MYLKVETYDFDPSTGSATLSDTTDYQSGQDLPRSFVPVKYLPPKTPVEPGGVGRLYTNITDAFSGRRIIDVTQQYPPEFQYLSRDYVIDAGVSIDDYPFGPPWAKRRLRTPQPGIGLHANYVGTNPIHAGVGVLAFTTIPLTELKAHVEVTLGESYIPLMDATLPQTRYRRMRVMP